MQGKIRSLDSKWHLSRAGIANNCNYTGTAPEAVQVYDPSQTPQLVPHTSQALKTAPLS